MLLLFADHPVNLAVGTTAEFTVAGLLLLVAIAGTVFVVRGVRGWELRFTALMLLGSALCIVFEPALDAVGGVWFATVNQHLGLPRMWGVKVGLHMLFAYYVFLGVTAVAITRYVRGGAGERELWRLYAVLIVLATALELPILYFTTIYTYYGVNQPFFLHSWLPLPLWVPVVNATLPFCMASIGLLLGSTGWRMHLWLIPIVMPASLFAIYFAQAWPVLTVLNSHVGTGVAHVCGVGTVALALLMMHFQSLALPRLAKSFALPDRVRRAFVGEPHLSDR
jgi:hypothetical protein